MIVPRARTQSFMMPFAMQLKRERERKKHCFLQLILSTMQKPLSQFNFELWKSIFSLYDCKQMNALHQKPQHKHANRKQNRLCKMVNLNFSESWKSRKIRCCCMFVWWELYNFHDEIINVKEKIVNYPLKYSQFTNRNHESSWCKSLLKHCIWFLSIG